ncbi:MAG TPA: L-threonylcarbamoyladenylate synthase [Thermoplasmata archaeon]|nr:L-threonylcarbamoyladenylate synthase [Thermoplasmata archaeon]
MAALDRAVRALGAGAIVAYPTDTLYGLGVRAADGAAVDRLRAAKGRPEGMPVSMAVSSTAEVEALLDLGPLGRRFVRTHLPGPFTILAPPSAAGRGAVAAAAIGPGGRLGIRVPDHPLARELARRAGPITSTSANRHGEPPCPTVATMRAAFGRDVSVYLEGAPRPSGRPSAIVDLTGDRPRPVRRG